MPSNEFKSLFNLSAKLALQVAASENIKVDELIWSDYVVYFQHNFNLKIKNSRNSFPFEIKDYLSGKIISKKGKTIIGINPYMPQKRQNFTTAHELSHFILHIQQNGGRSQSFNSLIDNVDASYSIEEQEADAFASFIMINPYAFLRYIAKDYDWFEIVNHFEISSSALYHRVLYYLTEQNEWPINTAKQILHEYEIGDTLELRSMAQADISKLIDHAGDLEFEYISQDTFELTGY